MYTAVPSKDEGKDSTYWRNTVLSRIFKADVDSGKRVKLKHWWHSAETSTITCDLVPVKIVIYLISSHKRLALMYANRKTI